jgi:hypothetical protein
LKRYKSPGSDQIPAELIQAGGKILRSQIHKLINSIWNKEDVRDQCKWSTTVPTHKKGDETGCSNYGRISMLSTTYKIISNILLSRLSPYTDEIIGDHQYGFRRKRSTANQIFCIRQVTDKKWENNDTLHQLFIHFKKAYQSVRVWDIHETIYAD